MAAPRILLYDLETSPLKSTTWELYDTNVIWVEEEWTILMFAYKWLGEKKTHVISQHTEKGWKPGKLDDRRVVEHLHNLFNEADILVAHNGDSFDQKKSQARFIYHNLQPVSPYQQVDTKKLAKKTFKFTSNKLDDLGEFLGLGRKLKTDKELWRGCLAGDKKSWDYMAKYNKQDVDLLEKVYLKLRPWSPQHPNLANLSDRPEACPRCGIEGKQWSQGWRYTKTAKYRRFQCLECGSYYSTRHQEKGTSPSYV